MHHAKLKPNYYNFYLMIYANLKCAISKDILSIRGGDAYDTIKNCF